ncbi:MAG: hypothetical protein ACM3S4_02055 [Burkholderiales bacterium]
MQYYGSFSGTVTAIEDFWTYNEEEGCNKLVTLTDGSGNIVNFVATPSTYVVGRETLNVGDSVTGFYDATLPVILIYPPQYRAVVMAKTSSFRSVKVDRFDSQLVSSDGALKLNVSPSTQIVLENDQRFSGSLENRDLIVVYGATTRSIPAQTTPYKIIVICRRMQ